MSLTRYGEKPRSVSFLIINCLSTTSKAFCKSINSMNILILDLVSTLFILSNWARALASYR